jgi:wyosine [tRNA(Phe)-imidazoG37] synthetase (radical SAM superfamily)
MPTFLFEEIIFGPVNSRRLGKSLGINLLPPDKKICNFDCIYCECGLTDATKAVLPSRKIIREKLSERLSDFKKKNRTIDTITFAGNGEPTLHPEFNEIVDDIVELRDTFFPDANLALLTNATTIINPNLRETLLKIEQSILKLDSVNQKTIELINCPLGNYDVNKTIGILKEIEKPIIQTMFLKGTYKGIFVDNTNEAEIVPWLDTIKMINPSLVMIYTISRDTPFETLKKIPLGELESIAQRVEDLGIQTQISA